MRREPCNVRGRIEALDQCHLVGGLVREVVPQMLRVVLHAKCRALTVGIDVACRDEVCWVEGAVVRGRKWVVGYMKAI